MMIMMINWTDLRDREKGKEEDQKDKIIIIRDRKMGKGIGIKVNHIRGRD